MRLRSDEGADDANEQLLSNELLKAVNASEPARESL
jgi:hypothetical protein